MLCASPYYCLLNLTAMLGILLSPFQGAVRSFTVQSSPIITPFHILAAPNDKGLISDAYTNNITVAFFQDDCQPLTSAQSLKGNIGGPGQLDCYTFQGVAGERVTLRLDNQTTGNILLSALTPAGALLASSTASASLEITLTLPDDGTYTLHLEGSNGAAGAYALDLLQPGDSATLTTAGDQAIISSTKTTAADVFPTISLSTAPSVATLGWWAVPSSPLPQLDYTTIITEASSGPLVPGTYDIYVTTLDLERQVPVALRIAQSLPVEASQLTTIPLKIIEVASDLPQIGPITFARDVTEDFEPIGPGLSFSGTVTEVHAIFDYSGFSPDDIWERVWFLNDSEVLRSAERWSGDEAGTFDYFINAGGKPLSPGKWVLEIYVEGNLLAQAGFTIVSETAPTAGVGTSGTGAGKQDQITLATPTPIPAPPAPPPPKTYKLAYTKWDGGKHNLFIGDTSGATEQFILSRAAGPSWSPDGQLVYFYGEEGVDRQEVGGVQYVFNTVSNGIVRVLVSPVPTNIGEVRLYQGADWKGGTIRWTSVSPNGQMLAYDARPGGDYRIYFLGTDENQQYKFEIIGEQADWSPDSQRLVYRSSRNNQTGIWISNRDDSGHTRITDGGSDSFPAWSPDGKTIAFSRDDGGNVNIYIMNVDGTNLRRLTDAPGPDTLPSYTPGGQIIFRSARTGSWGIWKMNGDGSNQQEIIPNAGVGPDWAYSKMDVY
jgi:Tol biopolymer transport system component